MERCYRCMRGHIVNGVCNNCRRRPSIHTGAAASKLVLQPGTPLANGEITIGAMLGKGGFGATYVADSAYDGVIALKEFLPGYMIHEERDRNGLVVLPDKQEIFHKSRDAFEKEAELLSKLKHPNIVKVLFKLWENNTVYYGMELLEGFDLANFIKTRAGMVLSAEMAAEFIEKMYPIMDALWFLHRRKVFHRDISPANIFLRGWNKDHDKFNVNFDPCLIDFGAAYVARDDYQKSFVKVKNLHYSPVEQSSSKANLGAVSDIYAFSATMYHALTGVAPQPATDRMMDKDELKKPSEINPALQPLDDVLMNGLKVLSKDRTPNMEQLIFEMKEAVKRLRPAYVPIPPNPDPNPVPIPPNPDPNPNPPNPDPNPIPPVPDPDPEPVNSEPKKDSAVKSIFALLVDIAIAFVISLAAVYAAGGLWVMVPITLLALLVMNLITMLAAKRSLAMLMFGMPKRAGTGKRVLAVFLRTLIPFALVDVILSACGAYKYALSNGGAPEAQVIDIIPVRREDDNKSVLGDSFEDLVKPIIQGDSGETRRFTPPPPPPPKPVYILQADYNGPDGKPAAYELYANTKYTVGRQNCDILIPETKASVSRFHCIVELRGEVVYITDRSKFGCYVNNCRIQKDNTYRWDAQYKVRLGDDVVFQLYENKK